MTKQKRIISAFLAFSMISTAFTCSVFAENEQNEDETKLVLSTSNAGKEVIMYGDLNDDGIADLTDLTCLSLYLMKSRDFSENQVLAADVDANGEVDIADLAYFKQYVCKDESVMSKLKIGDKKLIWTCISDENSNKPQPSNRIKLMSDSYCKAGETLTVNALVAASDASDDKDSSATHYTYSVCSVKLYDKTDDERLLVNGETSEFTKEYAKDEWALINVNNNIDDADKYYNEITEIDFKNYEPGSTGCLAFSFGETNDESPDNQDGMAQRLYFYVGENGTGIGRTAEEAEEWYLEKNPGVVEVPPNKTDNDDENDENQDVVETPPVEINPNYEKTIYWNGVSSAESSKPLPSNRITLNCISYFKTGESVTVNALVAASNASDDKDASATHYTYSVCSVKLYDKTDDERLLVNGETSEFTKEYTKDEWALINVNNNIDDADKYYNEITEIDFKNFEPGSSGCLAFSFGETNDEWPGNFDGMAQRLYFFVGENGVSIGRSDSEAILEYLMHNPGTAEYIPYQEESSDGTLYIN